MAAFAFEIVEHGNPVLLEPLTCKKPALELELAAFMQEYPQIQSSLRIAERVPFDDLPELSKCIREAKQDLGDAGRVIVRYSGTENKLRILAEASTESAARLWHDKIAGVAARELEVIP